MKVFHLEAEGASPEELEAIKVAIGEIASEIFSLDVRSSSQYESKEWRFSGRWWLEPDSGTHQIGTWGQ